VQVSSPVQKGRHEGVVVRCGTPGARDDTARTAPEGVVRARLASESGGLEHASGTLNPGNGLVTDRYVMSLGQHQGPGVCLDRPDLGWLIMLACPGNR
jgi:hypothetical protein